MKSIALLVVALAVACAKKETGARADHAEAPATSGGDVVAQETPGASGATTGARAIGEASKWFCFTLGRHASDTQCETSEGDCNSLLDVAREAAPQAAARTSCTPHQGAVFCFEETDDSGSARLCSNTQQGCDDARKGAVAHETKRQTGSRIGACAETR